MRFFLAGPYRSQDIIGVIGNIRRARQEACTLMALGHDVYCPHLDFEIGLVDDCDELAVEDYQRNSISFLLHWAEIVVLLPGWENSTGTLQERTLASRHGIPVVEMSDFMEGDYDHSMLSVQT